jgi:uncharacterized membrane protein required for colicin V production
VTVLDFAVLIIMGIGIMRGISKGLVLSVFHMISLLISALLTAKYYPVFSDVLANTKVYERVKNGIGAVMTKSTVPAVSGNGQEAAETIVESLSIPKILKPAILKNTSFNVSEVFGFDSIIEQINTSITNTIINVLSIIVLFVTISILLYIVVKIIDNIMKLPVLKTINKLSGGAFGAIKGLLFIYIIFGIISLFTHVEAFASVVNLIDNSIIAKGLYHNNILLKLIL